MAKKVISKFKKTGNKSITKVIRMSKQKFYENIIESDKLQDFLEIPNK